MAKRRKFTDQFKAKVALEALRGDKTIQEIAAKHQVLMGWSVRYAAQVIEHYAHVRVFPDQVELYPAFWM